MRRKKEASKVKQTNNMAKQHSTPKAVTFPRKNELPQVGLEPTTLYTLDRALYQLSYRGSSAGWAQISHLIVHIYMYMYIPVPLFNVHELTYMYILVLYMYTCRGGQVCGRASLQDGQLHGSEMVRCVWSLHVGAGQTRNEVQRSVLKATSHGTSSLVPSHPTHLCGKECLVTIEAFLGPAKAIT